MVEQPDRHVGVEDPGLGAVVGHAEPAVAADQHVIGVRGIEPDGVDVVVDHERGIGGKGFAAVDRELHLHAAHVDALGILGIDAHLREVHRARIGPARLGPGGAAVIRAEESVRLGVPFDRRIHRVGIATEDVDRNAPERTAGEAPAGDPGPRVATVGGLVERAPGTAAIHAAGCATTLVERRVQRFRIGEGLRDVVGAGVLIPLEHEFPGLAAVRRLVDATFTARAEERAGGGDERDLGVAGVKNDAVDVLGILEPDVRKGLAAIGGLPDAISPARGLTIVRFAGADPDDVGVAL